MRFDLRAAWDRYRAGEFAATAEACHAALVAKPDEPDVLHLLGLAELGRGNLQSALTALERAIEIEPLRAHYWAGLAEVHWSAGGRGEAITCLEEAVRLNPDHVEILCNLGASLIAVGRHDEALDVYRRSIEIRDDMAAVRNNLGNLLDLRGETDGAIEQFTIAARIEPGLPDTYSNLSRVRLERGEADLALAFAQEAVRLRPRFGPGWIHMGQALDVLGRLDEAAACFRRAIDLSTFLASANAGLAGVLEQAGELEESRRCLIACLGHDPLHAGALARLATREKAKLSDEHRRRIEGLIADPAVSPTARASLQFGLAHVMDALGDYSRAALLSTAANDGQARAFERRGRGYDPAGHERFVDELIAAFNPDIFARHAGRGSPSARPIFVVGMPRSGTSLVEQILASHPLVHGAGEIRLAQEVFQSLPDRDRPLRERLDRLDVAGIQTLANLYLKGLADLDPSAERVVDKMPENTLYLGLIAILFPNARLIGCRRDERDVALSCWMTDFRSVRWANRAGSIRSRIAQSDRLMEHWRSVLPSPILDVGYEETVDDLERRGASAPGPLRARLAPRLPRLPSDPPRGPHRERGAGPLADLSRLDRPLEAL